MGKKTIDPEVCPYIMREFKKGVDVLYAAILTEAGANAYCAELRHFPFPPRWGSSPIPQVFIFANYRVQECGRLEIIMSLLLRTWFEEGWMDPKYLRATEATMWKG